MKTAVIKSNYLWLAAIGILLLVYYFADPMQVKWMPKCIFHEITGLQCMGCGSQRVVHSLLHGNLRGALAANAFLVIILPFLFFLLIIETGRKKMPVIYKKVHSNITIIIISAMLVAWLIVRNILGI